MHLTQELINNLHEDNKEIVLDILKNSYKTSLSNNPFKIDLNDLKYYEQIVKVTKDSIDSNKSILEETFRCLNKIITFENSSQDKIGKETELIEQAIKIIENANDSSLINKLLIFLINLTVNHAENGQKIWKSFENQMSGLIYDYEYKITALINNILVHHKNIKPSKDVVKYIINEFDHENCDNEYLIFLMEKLLSIDHIIEIYNDLCIDDKKLALRNWRHVLTSNLKLEINLDFLCHLIGNLIIKSEGICSNIDKIDVEEYVSMLAIIAILSGREIYVKEIQEKHSLVNLSTNLLQTIHMLGKDNKKDYVPLPTLADLERVGTDVLDHPSYGFKASIIRLIGNLAWRHNKNQNEFTKLGVLAVLLDCCNMDARNPFIMQWVIFAVRNLCENNSECQKEIASLTRRGVIDSTQLNEFGMTLHSDDENNQIRIVPLPTPSKRH